MKRWKLVNRAGDEVFPGAKLTSVTGDEWTLLKFYPPGHYNSSGRVEVEGHGIYDMMFFPGVFGLKIAEVVE